MKPLTPRSGTGSASPSDTERAEIKEIEKLVQHSPAYLQALVVRMQMRQTVALESLAARFEELTDMIEEIGLHFGALKEAPPDLAP